MVSTRHHPEAFPDPPTTSSPSPSKSPSSTTSVTKTPPGTSQPSNTYGTPTPPSLPSPSPSGYMHNPSRTVMIWLLISLPLVIWDTGYVFLRPHSMPGGKYHSPLWTPYALYGTVDYMYGWPAWQGHVGFTAAQASLNVAETMMYGYYLWAVWTNGSTGKEGKGFKWFVWDEKRIVGVELAVLIAWAGAVMTVSKTVLYTFNEAFSGFENIGHNSITALILLWVIPNWAWIVLPSYMTYVMGKEILSAMEGSGKMKMR